MNTSALFHKIKRIEVTTNQLSKEMFAGAYRSAFRGQGLEFEEVREYQPGDDVRAIDWNVTARMQRPYVKSFREERDLNVMLLVDLSGSTNYGSHYGLKREFMTELGAVLAFSAIKNNDRVGMILFSDIIEKYIPPRKGDRHVLRLIRELLAFTPKSRGSSIKNALGYLGRLSIRSGICFLISDFLSNDYQKEAAVIAQKHDLIAIQIQDPFEKKFPKIGIATLRDLETGKIKEVDTRKEGVQKQFQSDTAAFSTQQEASLNKSGASVITIGTNESYVQTLQKFFRVRQLQRR